MTGSPLRVTPLRRASSFIWGCWHDADYLAGYIAEHRSDEKTADAAAAS